MSRSLGPNQFERDRNAEKSGRTRTKPAQAVAPNRVKKPQHETKLSERGRQVVAVIVGGAILAGVGITAKAVFDKMNEHAPLVDMGEPYRKFTFGEGDTFVDVTRDAYPLPDDYKTLSRDKQSDVQEAVIAKREAFRKDAADQLHKLGYESVGEIPAGATIVAPPDAAIGHVVDPSQPQ